jgi:iron complex transport system substrate-binding protein
LTPSPKTPERIVSLVPNGTEILFALGAGDRVVGVSHECDHPPEARALPQLTGSALTADLTASEIDRAVSEQLASGESLYTLDDRRIEELAPDLLVTQELCPVCAVSTGQVSEAVAPLVECPEILTLDPKTLGGVLEDIRTVGRAVGLEERAEELVAELESRLEAVRERRAGRPRPRVLALEWLDPPFLGGHWVPEMIEIAGGVDAAGVAPGEVSRPVTWDELVETGGFGADVIVAMPCGFDEAGARRQVEILEAGARGDDWRGLPAVLSGRAGSVVAVDANGCFSRPGPRLVEGVERLAGVFDGVATSSASAAPRSLGPPRGSSSSSPTRNRSDTPRDRGRAPGSARGRSR